MSENQQFNTPDKESPQRTGAPPCPQCSRPMSMRTMSPVLFAPDVDDVVYGCTSCNTEIKRSVRRA